MIDSKQIDKTDWNDHKMEDISSSDVFVNVYNPANETTYLFVRKVVTPYEHIFVFDSKNSSESGYPLCDGRVHKICLFNMSSTLVEVGTNPSDSEFHDESIVFDIGTVTLPAGAVMTIWFYWLEVLDKRRCIIHYLIT